MNQSIKQYNRVECISYTSRLSVLIISPAGRNKREKTWITTGWSHVTAHCVGAKKNPHSSRFPRSISFCPSNFLQFFPLRWASIYLFIIVTSWMTKSYLQDQGRSLPLPIESLFRVNIAVVHSRDLNISNAISAPVE